MAKENVIEIEGRVVEAFRGAKFLVELYNDDGNPIGSRITAIISGKLHLNHIKVLKGDKVKIEMSPYDLTQGRITWRYK